MQKKKLLSPLRWSLNMPSIARGSVAMAIADVFSKNSYTIPNKNAKILKIFERLETLKGRWVISRH